LLLFALVCALLGVAHADLVVVQKVEGGGLEGEMTIKFQGKKVRADLVLPISIIVDAETGESLMLQHRTKTFNRVGEADTRALADQLLKAQGASEPPKLTPTGEKKDIAGHPTEGFLWRVGQMKIRFWVAKDFPHGDAVQAQLNLLQNSGLGAIASSMMPSATDLPGVRLRTEFELGDKKIASTITSIKEEPVDPAVFKVPADYKEVAVPINGAGQEP